MIQIDKITHTLAGAAIAAALLPFGVIQSLLAVIVVAVGKELWDAQGHGTPDHIDALVTVIGGALMLGWLHLAQHGATGRVTLGRLDNGQCVRFTCATTVAAVRLNTFLEGIHQHDLDAISQKDLDAS